MLLDRFRRKPAAAPISLRGAMPQTLRALAVSLMLLPVLGPMAPHAEAGTPEPLVAFGGPARLPETLRAAQPLGRMAASARVKIALTLPWRDPDALATLLHRLSDPADALYKKFLTHDQFVARFAPSQSDYDALKTWAGVNGLSVADTTPTRNLLVVSGSRDTVESAFHVQLNRYRLATGREVYINDSAPRLPLSVAGRLSGVIGLTNLPLKRPLYRARPNFGVEGRPMVPTPLGNGPLGGLTPADIRSIYDINPLYAAGLSGAGQTIALFEQNGYLASDIAAYVKAYGLPSPTLSNVTIGGYDGTVTDTDIQGEVTLDIEMVLAVAPKAKILVYEYNVADYGQTIDNVVIDDFTLEQKIATDDLANIVSESYGGPEQQAITSTETVGGKPVGLLQAENAVFQEMAAQGQTMLASSGDTAAYMDESQTAGTTDYQVDVGDPASQPLVTAVGGTTLTSAPSAGTPLVATYGAESTWFTSGLTDPLGPEGGSGGESGYWTKPDYQTGVGASTTMRDLPDVSLNADPNTGYSVYQANGEYQVNGYNVVGGTSASCPLWAAFFALVNQQRLLDSLPVIGFANPDIYTAAEGKNYGTDFHDISDGSTNGVYFAGVGFDDCTGWGTYDAADLLPEFAPTTFGAAGINVKVVDTSGNPVAGATVTVTNAQLPSLNLTGTSAAKTGMVSFTEPAGIHNFNGTGQDAALSYFVSVSLAGFAGSSQGNVVPPATTQLTVLPTDHTYTAGSLQMISAPYDYPAVGDFAALFGLTPPLGSTTSGALFAYSPTATGYLAYPTAPADTLRLGHGYWAVLPTGDSYVRLKGVPAPTNQSYRIGLLPGWNMIGDPFLQPVSVSGITVDTINPGSPVAIGAASTVQLPLYTYNGSGYTTLGTGDSLQPFVGYWIHATQPAELVIPAP